MGTAMTVNDLARRVGIPAHVVRYYSQRGFLRPTRNARNAYREYGESDLHRLRFICRAKALGFTLKEIGLILQTVDGGVVPAAKIAQLVKERALSIERRNDDVQRVHRRIQDVIGSWPVVVDGTSIVSDLRTLIDAVAQEE
jgi:MerR family transcriptional regulator, Zn(II)-responsive regulator of zntA